MDIDKVRKLAVDKLEESIVGGLQSNELFQEAVVVFLQIPDQDRIPSDYANIAALYRVMVEVSRKNNDIAEVFEYLTQSFEAFDNMLSIMPADAKLSSGALHGISLYFTQVSALLKAGSPLPEHIEQIKPLYKSLQNAIAEAIKRDNSDETLEKMVFIQRELRKLFVKYCSVKLATA